MTSSRMVEQVRLLDTQPESTEFRPIQYLGSKFRLLGQIEQLVTEVSEPQGLVCDLFAGSGVVARRLAQKYSVLACDIQEYSRVLSAALVDPVRLSQGTIDDIVNQASSQASRRRAAAQHIIECEQQAIVEFAQGKPLSFCEIVEQGSIQSHDLEGSPATSVLRDVLERAAERVPVDPDWILLRYYGGVYFSYEQSLELDALASVARSQPQQLRDTVLAAVMSTASQIVSSVGNHFAQPVRPRTQTGKPKMSTLQSVARQRQISVFQTFDEWLRRYNALEPSKQPGSAIRADFRKALSSLPLETCTVYADPPYTRDHYSRFYHILETIAVGDEPQLSTVKIGDTERLSRGLYRDQRHQSPFCIKSQVESAFDALFAPLADRKIPLILSYSPYAENSRARPRLMTIEKLVHQASNYFGTVDVLSGGRIAHSKLNAERLNGEMEYEAEVFLLCKP